eukprot:gb/GECG01002352.1/.p1 GENE.gb/GECG01002352.1/~~gb/GECG01002352.1/.p1  ORF type:complete len:142 (+),score=19.86 gb/GECG01002352.1/:1-426(+)
MSTDCANGKPAKPEYADVVLGGSPRRIRMEVLKPNQVDQATEVLATAMAGNEPLTAHLGITNEDWMEFAGVYCKKAGNDQLHHSWHSTTKLMRLQQSLLLKTQNPNNRTCRFSQIASGMSSWSSLRLLSDDGILRKRRKEK